MKIIPRWTALALVLVLCISLLPGKAAAETTPPTDAPVEYNLYFGQLHAHTDLSDGETGVEEVFHYASGVAGLDFFAVTDHSQAFDNDLQGSLTADGTGISETWARGKAAAAAVTDGDFVGMFGFEMTWNQGQGHMNTYNTPGWLSRNQDEYQSYADGMENYFAALLAAEGSVSQFNHPGTEFGDFKDFACYSPALDQRITLMEVSGGLAAFHRALERGWHLAPTVSQNTHGSFWETDARTVILARELTEQSLYEAMSARRVYATEDRDLEIYYTLCGAVMGSVIPFRQGEMEISARLRDPTDGSIGTVEVIGPGGLVLATRTVSAAEETVYFHLAPEHSYYYLRITQPDGDVAVTAPVWLDGEEDMGISSLKTLSELTTAGEEQTIVLTLYNQEQQSLTVSAVTITDQETGELLHTASDVGTVPPMGTLTLEFPHTFEKDGVFTLEAVAQCLYRGESRSFRKELTVTVLPKPAVDQIIVDASHGNNPAVGNLISLAAKQGINMETAAETVTAQTLKTCRLLIIPAPREPFEEEFIATVADFVRQGGSVILCGTGDGGDGAEFHTAQAFNRLLEAMGSTMALYDDTALDYENNGGGPELLYTGVFGQDACLESLTEGQVYTQTSGCTVNPGGGTWLVKGYGTARSVDGDGDGLAGTRETVLLAVEDTAFGGRIYLSGALFLSDDGIGERESNPWALPSANRTLAETILGLSRTEIKTAPISQVRGAEKGRLYLVEGLVTAGTANPNTAFSDTIYIQDTTGGIAAGPYSAHGLELGRRVRVLGELGDGDSRLTIVTMEILQKEEPLRPERIGNAALAGKLGQLVQLEGSVVFAEYTADGEGVAGFTLEDSAGNRGEVRIEPNIRSGSTARNTLARIVQEGCQVSVVGISYAEQGKAVLRVRDCDEVTLLWSPPEPTEPETEPPTEAPTEPPTTPSTQAPTEPPTKPTTPPATKPKPTEAKPQTTKPKETTSTVETWETEVPTTEAPASSTVTHPAEILWMEPAVTALEPPSTGDYTDLWRPLLLMVLSFVTVFMLMKQNGKSEEA